jgi:hypothetical protein
MVVTATAASAALRCFGKRATIVGTNRDERRPVELKGTRGNDVIIGLGGIDYIDARGGDDLICAGGGDDQGSHLRTAQHPSTMIALLRPNCVHHMPVTGY